MNDYTVIIRYRDDAHGLWIGDVKGADPGDAADRAFAECLSDNGWDDPLAADELELIAVLSGDVTIERRGDEA